MLRGSIPIGKAFGIPLRLHYSWFIVFALVTWVLSTNYFPVTYPTWNLTTSILAGIVTSLLFFLSVLIHELMHSIIAQRAGIPVHSITLFIFGGVSYISEEPKQPHVEARIALAGPIASLVLGGIFWAVHFTLQGRVEFVTAVAFWLGWINIALAAFNLIPGFPMDGGRVLRAILWWRRGNLRSATRTASNVGRVVGYLFIFGGICLIFWQGNWFNGLWLALIGWFLQNVAVSSYRQLAFRESLWGHTVSEAMSRSCAVIPPELTIEQLVNEHILTSSRRCLLVAAEGRILGLVTIHNTKAIPRQLWSVKTVTEAMVPADKIKWIRPDQDLSIALSLMTEQDLNQLPVVENGNVVGMIARDNLLSFINIRRQSGAESED